MKQITTTSEKQTFNFAKKYAEKLRGGEIIGLIGNLGAGKTIFTKGIAAGLSIKKTITSPTFVLMKVYSILSPKSDIRHLVHIDAYRLKTAKDLTVIGAEEYFNRSDTITIIEWADRIKKILPKKTKLIEIKIINNKRKIILSSLDQHSH